MTEPSQQPPPGNVLSYYAPQRRRWHIQSRHARVVVWLWTLILLGCLIAAASRLTNVGPVLPKVTVINPQGITDNVIAVAITDKIAVGQDLPRESYLNLLEFIGTFGATVLGNERLILPSDEKALLDGLVIGECRQDKAKSIWWIRIPNGQLEIGRASAIYFPDHKRWTAETRLRRDETSPPDSAEVLPTSEMRYLQLPKGITDLTMRVRKGRSWSFGRELWVPDWQAPVLLRAALWLVVLFGLLVVLLSMRARTMRTALIAAIAASLTVTLSTLVWLWADRAIEPIDTFVNFNMTVSPRAGNWFWALPGCTAASSLLAISLAIYAWILAGESNVCTDSPSA